MATSAETARVGALRSAPLDSWVVLSEDETCVLAAAKSYEAIVEATDKLGIEDPIIVKTPPTWLPFAV